VPVRVCHTLGLEEGEEKTKKVKRVSVRRSSPVGKEDGKLAYNEKRRGDTDAGHFVPHAKEKWAF